MQTKQIILWVVLILAVLVGGYIIWSAPRVTDDTTPPTVSLPDTDTDTDSDQPDPQNSSSPNIHVDQPQLQSTISSPVTITGEAAGWYFEGTFPVEIQDQQGATLGQGYVTAQDEWMTENFVPFEGSVSFDPAGNTSGNIILRKANPSGLPQHDDSISIPVQFQQQNISFSVYFLNTEEDPNLLDCTQVYARERTVPFTLGVGRAAIEQLLEGPTEDEESDGYVSEIPDNVTLQDIYIEDETAYVDFDTTLEVGGGSCTVSAIRAQITQTLTQFPTVNDVTISINGESEEILQP